MIFKPFRPLSFSREVNHFYSPPFDTINREQERILKTFEHNITHITLPESPESALKTLTQWKQDGVLKESETESFMILLQEFSHDGRDFRRIGLIGRARIYPDTGDIKPHEKTFSGPRKNRMDLMEKINCQPEPIFLMTTLQGFSDYLSDLISDMDPDMDFEEPEGIHNRVFRIMNPGVQTTITRTLEDASAIVADGHHRLAATREVATLKRALGNDGWNYIMAYLCPSEDNGLIIQGTHRIVKTSMDRNNALEELGKCFTVTTGISDGSTESQEGAIDYYDGEYHILSPLEGLRENNPDIDFSVATDIVNSLIFRKCFNLSEKDIETSVVYSHDRIESIRMVDEGNASMCFLMPGWNNAAFARRVMDGGLLPQKSTYFYPKVPSGIALYEP